MPRRVLLLINRDKPEASAAAQHVAGLVESQGGTLVAQLGIRDDIPAALAQACDLVVVLGGDGSILGAVRRTVSFNLPILGVNLGKVGFMAEFDLESLRLEAPVLFSDEPLPLQKRPLLHASRIASGAPSEDVPPFTRETFLGLALNDCVVAAGPPFRMIHLGISIDGRQGPMVLGDGLVVATPMGSTAYNVAAGGPIISTDVQAFSIAPIAAHSLSFRPVVVSAFSTIELSVLRVNEDLSLHCPAAGTTLVLDGQVNHRLHLNDRVVIRQHELPVRFVRNPRTSYWDTLMRKLRWAAQPQGR